MQTNRLNKSVKDYRMLPAILFLLILSGLLICYNYLQQNKIKTGKHEYLQSVSDPGTANNHGNVSAVPEFLRINAYNLSMITKMNIEDVFEPRFARRSQWLVIMVLLFAASVASNVFFMIKSRKSESRQAKKKIHKLNEHNRLILESTGEGIIELSKSGNINFINKVGASMLGYTATELLNKNGHISFHHKKINGFLHEEDECLILKSIRTGKSIRITKDHFVKKDGTLIPVEYTTNPIIEDGQLNGSVLIYRDITEKQLAEEQIILAKEIAEESSKLKSAILMNMSHELRTPLNGILGFAQLLQRKMKGTPETKMIDRIIMSGDRLLSTLTNILELAQLESEQPQVMLTRHSLKNIIPDIAARYEPGAERKNLFLVNNIKNDYMVYADSHMLIKSLSHIIDNAIKFTSKGGISISADQLEKNGNLFTRIHIKDTGIGIPEKEAENIFTEFHQLSQGYQRKYEGTGVGLSLVNKMIVLMKGDISLKSEPGKGSIFTVSLPSGIGTVREVMPESEISSGYTETIIPNSIKPQNILVVEDNYTNAQLISAYLEDLVKLEHAANGETALKMAVRKKYDMVLMDINLGPGIDGLDTTTRMRRIPGYDEIPIIAVTGYTMASDKERILNRGCDYFISKPFSQEKLKSLINEIAKNRS